MVFLWFSYGILQITGNLPVKCLVSSPFVDLQTLLQQGAQLNLAARFKTLAVFGHLFFFWPPLVFLPKEIPSGKLSHNYGQSPCLMGKFTINGNFQLLCNKLPEGKGYFTSVSSWFTQGFFVKPSGHLGGEIPLESPKHYIAILINGTWINPIRVSFMF